ncbi:MAG TPA: arylsulfatase [Planctomycetota bacterium]|nr:arylsulfatase [Planctomycetota bacterium]
MNRRTFLRGVAAIPAAAALARLTSIRTARAEDAPPARPNVVLFLVDDQGYGDLALHGNLQCQTPHMDALARESVELTDFHVCPVCAPTRASLLTGRYHFRTGVTDVFGDSCKMRPEEVTLAEALRTAGYATGIFGKWHLGDEKPHRPMDQGFDESLVFRGASLRKYFDPPLLHNGAPKAVKGYCTDIFVDHAIGFIRRHKDQPFFVYVPTNLIHTPLQVAESYSAPFKALGLDQKTAAIYGMLKNVDDNLGRLRAALKDLGLDENTLFIYTSDNGPCAGSVTLQRFMAGLHGLKGTPFENGIRTPCFLRWPKGFECAGKVDRLAAHIDIMPTVLDACGVAPPAGVKLDGTSLLPLLRNRAAPWPDRTLFFQWDGGPTPHRGMAYAVRTQQYKLVQPVGAACPPNQKHIRDRYTELCVAQGRGHLTLEGEPRYLLFDVAADPGEKRDIAAQHPNLVEKLRKQYEAWFDDVWTTWHQPKGQVPNL